MFETNITSLSQLDHIILCVIYFNIILLFLKFSIYKFHFYSQKENNILVI